MAVHPCCGNSLQTGTKIVAILEIIGAVFMLILAIFGFFSGVFLASNADTIANLTSSRNGSEVAISGSSEKKDDDEKTIGIIGIFAIVGSIIILIQAIVYLILGILLLKGAQQRNIRKCRIWLIVQCIFLGIAVMQFVLELFGDRVGFGGSIILQIVLDLYFIWIVWAFIKELQQEETGGGRDAEGAKQVVFSNKA